MTTAQLVREFVELPLALIDEPALASRSDMNDEKMVELVASIRAVGLINPISVVRIDGRYGVVAGHRRRIACERAGLVAVHCIVYPSAGAFLDAIQFAENRFREELTPTDEAIWFAELLEQKCAGDTDRLAALVHESRSYVEGRLLLFQGDPLVFEALAAGKIPIGVAHELNRCDEAAHRRMLLGDAIDGGATIALVRGWVSEYFRIHKPAGAHVSFTPSEPTLGAASNAAYFTCAICHGTDNVPAMQPVQIHHYCKAATFDKMLALFERRHEFTAWPRTLDEARALIEELSDRFPALLEPADPRRI